MIYIRDAMYFKYGLEDKPPRTETLIFGVQWLAVTIPTIIIIGNILAAVNGGGINISYLQSLLLMVGAVMLVQLLYGHKLPLVVGPAAVLLIAVLASQGQTSGAINTSIIIGGAVLGVALLSGCARQTLVAEPTAAPPGPYSNAGSPAHGADGAAGGLGTDGRME